MAGDPARFTVDGAEVYFQSHRAGIEARLAERVAAFIAATQTTLDCAVYDLRAPEVVAALAAVARSGKRLRIAYDASKEHTGGVMGDPKAGGQIEVLEQSGLLRYATPIHHGRQLMHDKFFVRDGRAVWTGSANFTKGGLELQDNNCLMLPSPTLAAAYTVALEAMLAEEPWPARAYSVPAAIGGMRVTPYFAPAEGEHIEHVVERLLRAARTVRVMAFLLSDAGILGALEPMGADPRFDIRGVYDPHGMENVLRYTQQPEEHFWFLRDRRFVAAPTHAFAPDREQDFMHNKVMVLDDRLVITGSYNFSENAEANSENLLVIESPAAAAAYIGYFDALWNAYSGTGASVGAQTDAHSRPREEETHMPHLESESYAHVLRTSASAPSPTSLPVPSRLANETVAGQTAHVVVYTDGSADGNASAQAVLASFEADYAAVQQWFGGISLPPGQEGDDQTTVRTALPIHVLMDPNAGGAYHFGCDATDLYIEPAPQSVTGLVVAEMVEIFEAAINNGWNCGRTNGEALSRVLAVARNDTLAPIVVQTGQSWWADGHADYVTSNAAGDTDQDGNGCGTLFLYYLRSQLGFRWEQIATTGGTSLGDCYQRLTGKAPGAGFNDFVARLATLAQGGQLSLPASGNPFPIGGTAQPGASGSAAGASGSGASGAPSDSPALPANKPSNAPIIALVVLIILVAIALVGALVQAIH